jgi:molybdenum cofactor synthesis domain-containing protein
MIARGGQEVWFRDATGLIGEGGNARLLGVMVDITDRKRAERLQEDTSATLEMIARGENLPDALLSVARMVERHCPGVKVMVWLDGDSGLRPAWPPLGLDGDAAAGATGRAAERALEDLSPVFAPLDGRAGGFGTCWCLPVVSGLGRGLGVLAAVGVPAVPVHPRARVAVLTTGDELVDASERPGPGQIRDANLHAICAQVAACGAIPVPFARVRDDRATLAAALREALEADAVLTTGGISVGDYDFVKPILEELGAHRVFWKVAQKPGGPLGFWMLGEKPIFGLPGNPVAAMLMVEEYVRPALRRLMGFSALRRPVADAVLEDGWAGKVGDRRTTFLRVVARREGGRLLARLTGPQGSAILSSMLDANALAVVPPGVDRVEPGGAVTLHLTELAEDH